MTATVSSGLATTGSGSPLPVIALGATVINS